MPWGQLKMMADENKTNWMAVDRSIPTLCPLDGFPLISNPQNPSILDCPMGNYTWPLGLNYSFKDNVV